MFRPRLVVASGAVLLCATPSVAVAVSISHATFWHNKANTVTCGLMIVPKEVLCSAEGVPAPPHTSSADGDPGFVQLAAGGKPKTLRSVRTRSSMRPR
jgi:hypothetical protein